MFGQNYLFCQGGFVCTRHWRGRKWCTCALWEGPLYKIQIFHCLICWFCVQMQVIFHRNFWYQPKIITISCRHGYQGIKSTQWRWFILKVSLFITRFHGYQMRPVLQQSFLHWSITSTRNLQNCCDERDSSLLMRKIHCQGRVCAINGSALSHINVDNIGWDNAWCQTGNKPLSESVNDIFAKAICIHSANYTVMLLDQLHTAYRNITFIGNNIRKQNHSLKKY